MSPERIIRVTREKAVVYFLVSVMVYQFSKRLVKTPWRRYECQMTPT